MYPESKVDFLVFKNKWRRTRPTFLTSTVALRLSCTACVMGRAIPPAVEGVRVMWASATVSMRGRLASKASCSDWAVMEWNCCSYPWRLSGGLKNRSKTTYLQTSQKKHLMMRDCQPTIWRKHLWGNSDGNTALYYIIYEKIIKAPPICMACNEIWSEHLSDIIL